eukprot:jgi/Tetstr1/438412/TSEL_002897.t1
MVADARCGRAIQQERPVEKDARVALPAPIAADIMDIAIELRRTLKATNVIGFPLSLMLHLPIADVPDPADLLDWYSTSRDASSRRFYGASPPPNFGSVSPLEPSATWPLSATLAD